MADTDAQISRVFADYGLATKEIRHNDNLDRWRVSITAEGSDDGYLRDIGEIGSSKPVDYTIDFNAVRAALPQIDGMGIIDGTVNVEGTESGDILITIE